MKNIALDLIRNVLFRGAVVLGVVTAFASMYAPSPLAPLFHNPDMKAQANSVLYFTAVLVIGTLTYVTLALILYRAIKRSFTARSLATGREFDDQPLRRDRLSAVAAGNRAKAVTIPSPEFEQEVASILAAIYPIRTSVDTSGKGKINIKLYNDKGAMVGVAQASQDAEDARLKPDVLKSLNSYKSKANLPRAFFVTTAQFRDETLQQAKMMGITLIDGPQLDAWRKRLKAKA